MKLVPVVANAVEGSSAVNVAVLRWELDFQFIPREAGVHVRSIAVVVVRGEDQTATWEGEGSHFLVRLVDVPIRGEVSSQ